MRAVDDGRQREHSALCVIQHRVHDGILDDVHKLAQVLVVFQVVLQGNDSMYQMLETRRKENYC